MTPKKSPYASGWDDAVDVCRAIIGRSASALANRPCPSPHHRQLELGAMIAIGVELTGLRTDAPDPDAPAPVDPDPQPPVAPAAAMVAA